MPTLETYNGYPLWEYIPSLPAAIIFAMLFGLATIYHTYLATRQKMWFCLPFIIGGLCETIGYIGRALAYNATGQLNPYIIQSVLLLIAPVLFAATLYMTLSRIIIAVDGADCSLISPRWLTRIFVFCDCFSFLIQSSGAGLLVKGSDASSAQTGENIIIAGLIFQVLMFGVFIVATLVFNIRFKRLADASYSRGGGDGGRTTAAAGVPWQGMLTMLYTTSVFVIVRNIVRTAEYAMGQTGYLLTHEWTIYVFDGCLMLATMAVFAWKYPSQVKKWRVTSMADTELAHITSSMEVNDRK